jgi:opacity protein-like surface antigen
MKNIIQTIIVVLLSVATAVATPWSAQEKYQPEKGDQALQFQINSNFSLSAFEGDLISYKWMMSDRRGIRIGFGLNSHLGTEEDSSEYPAADSLNENRSVDRWQHSLQVTALLVTVVPSDKAWFYYGFGPTCGYTTENTDYDYTKPDPVRYSSGDSQHFEAGVAGIAGVEWALNSFLTLHAEYRSEFLFQLRRTEYEGVRRGTELEYVSTTELHYWRFTSRGVRFGLSVYF